MTRNCQPEIRDYVAMRMRKRAEIQKREAKAAGNPSPDPPAKPPHFTSIQNVRFPLSKRPNSTYLSIGNLPHSPRGR